MVETHLKNNYIDWLPVKDGEALLCVSERLDNLEGMWDYILVSEGFAKVPALIHGKSPYQQFFANVKAHLKPKGHLILAVDNRYGLSYFAGCKEHLTGKYFEGLEGYRNSEGICTFSREAILEMVKEAGFCQVKTYYPYPNYRYMTALYTDDFLPSPGELNTNFCNFEEERLVIFNEGAVFDGLLKEGKFGEFSNSYIFDLTMEKTDSEEELLFLKYSAERDEKYRIRTEILRKKDGTKLVRKIPYGEKSVSHVEKIKYWEERLREQYAPAGVQVNRCTMAGHRAEFEFLKGETLENVLDEFLEKGRIGEFFEKIKEYTRILEKMLEPKPFTAGSEFKEIFGEINFATPQLAAELNNIDLIFSNIILINGKWHVIDYEWTFDFEIPLKFIIYRAVNLYCGQRKQISLQKKEICDVLGISSGEMVIFEEMEHRLQKYLLGDTKTMAALQQEYAGKVMELTEVLKRAHASELKIYQDFGQGFSEEHSYLTEAEEDFYGRRRVTLLLPPNVTAIRLDPCEEPCMVTVNRILGECGGSYELKLENNGKSYDNSILYTSKDPQLILTGIVPGTSQIHVDITVDYLREETGYMWMKLLQKAEKCDRIENSKIYRLMKKIKNIFKKG